MPRTTAHLWFVAFVPLVLWTSIAKAQWTDEAYGPIPKGIQGGSTVSVPVNESPTSRHRFTDRPFQLGTRMGFGTTVGLAGLVGEYNVDDRLALGGGGGVNPWGPVWCIHARVRPLIGAPQAGSRLHALTFETAFSQGNFALHADQALNVMPSMNECSKNDTSGCSTHIDPRWVSWLQFELGWETRAPGGFALLLSSGVATRLNSPNWQCSVLDTPTNCGSATPDRFIYTFTVSLGQAF